MSDEAPVEMPVAEAPLQEYVSDLKARKEMKIDVRVYAKASTLVSAGEPQRSSILSDADLSPQPSFQLDLGGPQSDHLPRDVREYRDELARWRSESREIPKGAPLPQPPTSASLHIEKLGFDGGTDGSGHSPEELLRALANPNLEVQRTDPPPGPPLALLGDRILVPPREYSTVGSVSQATSAMLRRAGRDYPAWVADRYLQLPDDFPKTVKALARDLTRDQETPYDMAQLIRLYLHGLPYSLDVQSPPPGQDWVEYFLFVQRKGFCQNYASAMITMLRSLGVPARMVVGYAPGVWNEGRSAWEVQSRHYHAWPEVYFPEYGWIEFEPTPADVQPALEALGIRAQGGLAGSPLPADDCLPEILGGCIEPGGEPDLTLDELLGLEEEPGVAFVGDSPSDSGLGYLSSSWTLLGLIVVLAMAVLGGSVSYVRWNMSRLGPVTVTYASMCFLGRLAGVGMRAQETPREYCARLSRVLPQHAVNIAHITQWFVNTRYGGPGKAREAPEIIRAFWRPVRGALMGRMMLRLVPGRH